MSGSPAGHSRRIGADQAYGVDEGPPGEIAQCVDQSAVSPQQDTAGSPANRSES